ncbi:MAG: nucleoside-diphosphate kinase [Candidatus Micrarchaeia archaeon]
MIERTLVLIKPDGVYRSLVGRIITEFENAGLKIVAMKLVKPTKELAMKHYPADEGWYNALWEKTKKSFEEQGKQFNETPQQTGDRVRGYLVDYIAGKPVVAMVVEGNEAIQNVRKLAGATSPSKADPSTIRGKYTTDSYDLADYKGRAVKNIVHASDGKDTAEREIGTWFDESEIVEYKRADEDVMY